MPLNGNNINFIDLRLRILVYLGINLGRNKETRIELPT